MTTYRSRTWVPPLVQQATELATIDRDFLGDGPLGTPVPAAILERVVAAILVAVGGQP